jgi:hypothetical protein
MLAMKKYEIYEYVYSVIYINDKINVIDEYNFKIIPLSSCTIDDISEFSIIVKIDIDNMIKMHEWFSPSYIISSPSYIISSCINENCKIIHFGSMKNFESQCSNYINNHNVHALFVYKYLTKQLDDDDPLYYDIIDNPYVNAYLPEKSTDVKNALMKKYENTSYSNDIELCNLYAERKRLYKRLKNGEILSDDLCLEAMHYIDVAFKYIKNQTIDICLRALDISTFTFHMITNRTEEIILKAVKKNHNYLRYLNPNEQTEIVCIEAVRNDGCLLQYVNNQTHNICIEAIKNNERAFRYVHDITYEICLEAAKAMDLPDLFEIVPDKYQTKELCMNALKYNGKILQYISHEKQDEELCTYAINQNVNAFRYVNHNLQTYEMCMYVVKNNGLMLKYVKNKAYDLCLEAVKQNGYAIEDVPINEFTDDEMTYLYEEAIKNKPCALEYVINQTYEMCIYCVSEHDNSIRYVNIQYFTHELCMKAIHAKYNDGYGFKIIMHLIEIKMLNFSQDEIDELYICAIRQNPMLLEYIKNKTYDICFEAISLNPMAVECVSSRDNFSIDELESLYMNALKKDLNVIRLIKVDIHDIFMYCVEKNGLLLKYIKHQTIDLCIKAIKQNVNSIIYVDKKYLHEAFYYCANNMQLCQAK